MAFAGPVFEVRMSMSDRPRVLFVVDDNQDVLSTFEAIFGRNGYDVRTFDNGRSFINGIELQKPDVAVIDINLPEMSGFDLAKLIRGREELVGVALIAVSGDSRDAIRDACLDGGFDLFFAKPFRLRIVCEEVTEYLRSREVNGPAAFPPLDEGCSP